MFSFLNFSVDDWFNLSNSCHVHKYVQDAFHVIAMITSTIGIVVLTAAVVYYGLKWRYFPMKTNTVSNTGNLVVEPGTRMSSKDES